jgi:two-component system response regulator NreC
MAIQVLLADDHAVVREGLRALLEREGLEVMGEASDGMEAVRLAQELRPNVAILDVAMPVMNGIDAAREIRQVSPLTKSILLTMFDDDSHVLQALHAGVQGYVLKDRASSGLITAIQEVHAGHRYLSPGVCKSVIDAYLSNDAPLPDPLSPRGRQVLQLIAEGKRTKEIATMLDMTVKTAESHRTRIMEKLQIHDTASLVRYAIRLGLIEP